jgi:proline dehydrogenase
VIATLVRAAAARYVVGTTAVDAARVSRALAERGYTATLAYWDAGGEDPEAVAAEYRLALEASRATGGYVSVKATAVDFSAELLAPLADTGVRLHLDAMQPETVDTTWRLIRRLSGDLGVTLPGRWSRSDGDADLAAELGLAVRVVKGMWAGPDERDAADGFLSVVDRLAGRARFVAVATHDRPLAAAALERLRAAGTPYELEQLYGLPLAEPPARLYLPYGNAWLPYALSRFRPRPRTLWWFARDLAGAALASRGAAARSVSGFTAANEQPETSTSPR